MTDLRWRDQSLKEIGHSAFNECRSDQSPRVFALSAWQHGSVEISCLPMSPERHCDVLFTLPFFLHNLSPLTAAFHLLAPGLYILAQNVPVDLFLYKHALGVFCSQIPLSRWTLFVTHSLRLSNHFILGKVVVGMESILGKLGARWEYMLDNWIQSNYRALFTHTDSHKGNFSEPIHLPNVFGRLEETRETGGNPHRHAFLEQAEKLQADKNPSSR